MYNTCLLMNLKKIIGSKQKELDSDGLLLTFGDGDV